MKFEYFVAKYRIPSSKKSCPFGVNKERECYVLNFPMKYCYNYVFYDSSHQFKNYDDFFQQTDINILVNEFIGIEELFPWMKYLIFCKIPKRAIRNVLCVRSYLENEGKLLNTFLQQMHPALITVFTEG